MTNRSSAGYGAISAEFGPTYFPHIRSNCESNAPFGIRGLSWRRNGDDSGTPSHHRSVHRLTYTRMHMCACELYRRARAMCREANRIGRTHRHRCRKPALVRSMGHRAASRRKQCFVMDTWGGGSKGILCAFCRSLRQQHARRRRPYKSQRDREHMLTMRELGAAAGLERHRIAPRKTDAAAVILSARVRPPLGFEPQLAGGRLRGNRELVQLLTRTCHKLYRRRGGVEARNTHTHTTAQEYRKVGEQECNSVREEDGHAPCGGRCQHEDGTTEREREITIECAVMERERERERVEGIH